MLDKKRMKRKYASNAERQKAYRLRNEIQKPGRKVGRPRRQGLNRYTTVPMIPRSSGRNRHTIVPRGRGDVQ